MARFGAMPFFPPPLVHQEALELHASHAAIAQRRTALQSGHFAYGLRYVDPRMARAMLNDPESMARMAHTRSTLDFEPRDDPPRELTPESDIRKIQPAKAPLLRKSVEKAFARLFSPQKSKLPGGGTRCAGSIHGADGLYRFFFAVRPSCIGL